MHPKVALQTLPIQEALRAQHTGCVWAQVKEKDGHARLSGTVSRVTRLNHASQILHIHTLKCNQPFPITGEYWALGR